MIIYSSMFPWFLPLGNSNSNRTAEYPLYRAIDKGNVPAVADTAFTVIAAYVAQSEIVFKRELQR